MKILLFRLSIYLELQINYRRDYLETQNLFQRNPYGDKCTCRRLNHQVMLITSGDIVVWTFWRPSWTPSWIMEKAPAGIMRSFSMLFLMVLGRFPEKFSLGIFFPLQHDYRSNTICLSSHWRFFIYNFCNGECFLTKNTKESYTSRL